MRIINDTETLIRFQAWSGAVDTQNTIIEAGKAEEFEQLIDELYPDGISDVGLNDLLWFESDWIYEQLGMEMEG